MEMHHVGIAVDGIEKGADVLRRYYGEQIVCETGPVHDPLQQADLHLFELRDGSRIELVAGRPAESALRRGMSLHHVCYEVPSVERALDDWQQKGAVIVSQAKPAVLFGGRLVAFVLTPLGLIEFLSSE